MLQCGGDHWIRDHKEMEEAEQLHAQSLLNEGKDPLDTNHLLAQVRMMFLWNQKGIISEDWLLPNSQSTIDIFKNEKKPCQSPHSEYPHVHFM